MLHETHGAHQEEEHEVDLNLHGRRGLEQCFSTTGPRPGTAPWNQLYWPARGSPGVGHFSFLGNFHQQMFYSGNILRRKIFVNVSNYKLGNYNVLQDFISPVTDD